MNSWSRTVDRLEALNVALAAEIVSALRYRRHHSIGQGLSIRPVAYDFLVQANEDLARADAIVTQIVQIGGTTSLVRMILDDLASDRASIEAYRAVIDELYAARSKDAAAPEVAVVERVQDASAGSNERLVRSGM